MNFQKGLGNFSKYTVEAKLQNNNNKKKKTNYFFSNLKYKSKKKEKEKKYKANIDEFNNTLLQRKAE